MDRGWLKHVLRAQLLAGVRVLYRTDAPGDDSPDVSLQYTVQRSTLDNSMFHRFCTK